MENEYLSIDLGYYDVKIVKFKVNNEDKTYEIVDRLKVPALFKKASKKKINFGLTEDYTAEGIILESNNYIIGEGKTQLDYMNDFPILIDVLDKYTSIKEFLFSIPIGYYNEMSKKLTDELNDTNFIAQFYPQSLIETEEEDSIIIDVGGKTIGIVEKENGKLKDYFSKEKGINYLIKEDFDSLLKDNFNVDLNFSDLRKTFETNTLIKNSEAINISKQVNEVIEGYKRLITQDIINKFHNKKIYITGGGSFKVYGIKGVTYIQNEFINAENNIKLALKRGDI